ncbi:flagellin [Acidisphaera sp. L21]|uniref:flagellin n=1 Tax=Acidisphaera sp. L21 TaxID=1641851 RepID=UPI00131E1627|nr:flagellin [Acidisphaera sp. L21]
MNVSDYGTLGRAVYASGAVKSQLDTLSAQIASGHVADSYAGLGAAAQTSLDLRPQLGHLATEQSAIDAVTGQLGVSQSALTQITSIASNFNAQLATLNNVTPTQIDSLATSARSAIQQVASLLDSTDGGSYVFAGTDTANPPIPDPDNITTSGFYTQIAAAVQGLSTNGAAATAAQTLSIASSDAGGTTPFSGPPGQVQTLQLGTSAPVQVGVLANQNTLTVSGGTSTTGSYMRDILRGLATIANLSSTQANDPGFVGLVQDTQASMSGAITAIGSESGALGNIQSSLKDVQTQAGDANTALTAQVSSVEDVDMAKTISSLSQVQTQLSASYKLISEVSKLSLVDYL